MLDAAKVAERLDDRDGFSVVSYREVGLPIFRLSCLVTFQEASQLGAIEEFTLRALAQGVDTFAALQAFLGLPAKILTSQLGRLVFENAVVARAGSEPATYALTPEGASRLGAASVDAMIRQRIPLYYDGITRRLAPMEAADAWAASQLDDLGVSVVAPVPRHSPKERDIDLSEVNQTLRTMARLDAAPRRAVRVDAIVGKPSLVYRKAVAVAFKSHDGRRMALGFAIEGRRSGEHEIAFDRSGGMERSPLFAALLDASKRRRDVQNAKREFAQNFGIEGDAKPGERKVLRLGSKTGVVPASRVRVLSVYDHPPLLRNAFKEARHRIVLISPWIRAAVVNEVFVKSLVECLDRGVAVAIGYGIGRSDPDERPQDKRARESLEAVAKAFPSFQLVRKGNTHAKVLLVDDRYFVTTSFNWLSFAGDPRKPMREEEGTLVEDPAAVNAYYEQLIARLRPA